MAKKRVHEIAKEQGLASKDLLEKLQAAGMEVKAAASSVEEAEALKVLGGNGATATQEAPPQAPAAPADGQPAAPAPPASAQPAASQAAAPAAPEAPKQRPTRDSLAGERAPGTGGGRRRVVIDSQASRRQDGRGGPP